MRPQLNDCEIDAQSTEPFARPHAHPLAPLTHLRSAAVIRSLARSVTRARAHGKEVSIFELNASISYHFDPQCARVLISVEKHNFH